MITLEALTPIILGLLTLVGVLINAYWQRKTHRNTAEINDAVNHRHLKPKQTNGDSPPKLYDLALENHKQINHVNKKVDGLVEWRMTFSDHVGEMENELVQLKREQETNDVENR